MKKAALYARVSSLDQREGRTIESQIEEIKRHIVGNDHLLVKEYLDDGYTGTRLDRPALERMRADLKTKTFDAIYFLHADRMARDSTHQDIVIDDVLRNKKLLYINNEDYEHSPENYFKLKILGLVSELERAKIIERTTRGRRHRLRQGQIVSQGHSIFGYRYVKKTMTSPPGLVIQENEAQVVRKMFELYATGKYGLAKLTRYFEEKNVLTRMGKAMWRGPSIRSMLKNSTYAGTRFYNRMYSVKESARTPGKRLKFGRLVLRDRSEWIPITVPALISKDLFEKVQHEIQRRGERYQQPQEHQLLSRLVRCGDCGYAVSSYRRRVGVWLKIGIRRIYHKAAYKCMWRVHANAHAKHVKKPCTSSEVMTNILESKVFAMIRETMLDVPKLRACMDFFKKDYRADQKKVEWRLMRIDKKLLTIEKDKKKIIDRYISGQMAHEEYVKQNLELDQELLQTKYKREQLLETIPLLHKKDLVEMSIRQFYDNAKLRLEKCHDFNSKRQFLLDHLEQIIYQKDKVTIIGSVVVEVSDRTSNSKIEFKIESDFNKKEFHKKDRTKYLVDGRLKEWGSGGRDAESYKVRVKELQLPAIKASQITQQTSDRQLRDGYMSYTAKSYLKKQKVWNEARESLINNIVRNTKNELAS